MTSFAANSLYSKSFWKFSFFDTPSNAVSFAFWQDRPKFLATTQRGSGNPAFVWWSRRCFSKFSLQVVVCCKDVWDNASELKDKNLLRSLKHEVSLILWIQDQNSQAVSGMSPAGGQWCSAPHLKSVPPHSRLAPWLLPTSNTVFLKCGRPFWFLAPPGAISWRRAWAVYSFLALTSWKRT